MPVPIPGLRHALADVAYSDTASYYWPLIQDRAPNSTVPEFDSTVACGDFNGSASDPDITQGPWGFGQAMLLHKNQCAVKSSFGKRGDACIMNPLNCPNGISFSLWEKVIYDEDVLVVDKDHDKQYIFSTGGDFNETTGMSSPGMALYHQGMDVVAVVSTGPDVYFLSVRGQLVNESWSNIGIRWSPYLNSTAIDLPDRGGLEMFVNGVQVGRSYLPLERPMQVNGTAPAWIENPALSPSMSNEAWEESATGRPVLMVGCHRSALTEPDFVGCRTQQSAAFDELSIWTWALTTNRTVDETVYFMGGYMAMFEDMTEAQWLKLIDQVQLSVASQAQSAAYITATYFKNAQSSSNTTTQAANSTTTNSTMTNSTATNSTGSNSTFPRNAQQQADYDRQILQSSVGDKLLTTAGALPLDQAKYIAPRFSLLPVTSLTLEDTHANLDGWLSVQLDPNEEGSSRVVREMENYTMTFVGSTNIFDSQDYPPLYAHNYSQMVVHSSSDAYLMSSFKILQSNFSRLGTQRIQMRDFYFLNRVNPTSLWMSYKESIGMPTTLPWSNQTRCGKRPITVLTAIYPAYGKFAPLRRNPSTVTATAFKVDSKVISVQVRANPRPNVDNPAEDFSDCQVDPEQMKYTPISLTFYHLNNQTSLRKLLWHSDDLETNIDHRQCAYYNPDIGVYGAWDASHCTTVVTEWDTTVCECSKFGTYAVLAILAEDPEVPADYTWLRILKYVGLGLSIVLTAMLVAVIAAFGSLWDMFHLLRLNSGLCALMSAASLVAAELDVVRADRHANMAVSGLQLYWLLATALFLLAEAFAMFRAITAGIIGGKTWAYIFLAYGLPLVDLGLTIYLYPDDFGTDPRAFIGWNNATKSVFFYLMLPAATLSLLLCLVVVLNASTPRTRKDSVVDHLTSLANGLAIVVFYFFLLWLFAYWGLLQFPGVEMANFYPIFGLMVSWFGVLMFIFLGMASLRFRMCLVGKARDQTHFTLAYLGRKSEFDDVHERLDGQDEEEVVEEEEDKKENEDILAEGRDDR